MRYSALMLAGLAFTTVSAAPVPTSTANTAYFCGSAPPGWVPPGQRKPVDPSDKTMPCHMLMSDRHKPRQKARGPFLP